MSDAAIELGPASLEPHQEPRSRFWELVWIGALTQFRQRYAGSVLGYAWTIAQPLALFGVLYLVFTRVVRFDGNVPNYPMLLLLNVALFYFFREATTGALRSFVGRGSILRSIRVNPLAMPLSAILASTFQLGFNLLVVGVWIVAYGISPSITWLLIPVLILYLLGLVAALGVFLATMYVRFRDIGMAWAATDRLLFFASPVLYPFELIKGDLFIAVASFNPLSPMLAEARRWILEPGAPSWPDVAGGTFNTIAPFLVYGVIGVASVIAFKRTKPRIAESL